MSEFLRSAMKRTWRAKLGYLLARNAFKALRDKLDPSKSNGGVFLGLNGVVVKSHGGTDAEGFAYAVDVGYEMVRYDLLTKINQMLNRDGSPLVAAPTAQEAVS
jgi:glycerol-3-phosphate acyltransferase PlsX